MKKMRAIAVLMFLAILSVLIVPQYASATTDQKNYPNDLKWGGNVICVESHLDSTWDTYISSSAVRWGYDSKLAMVAKFRTSCGPTYFNKTITIDAGARPDGILASTYNVVVGSYPNRIMTKSSIIVDVSKFWANNPATRRPIICHELGHSLGIEHYISSTSCMNTKIYAGVAIYPHQRDMDVLIARYGRS